MIKRKPSDLSVKTYLKELLKNMQLQDGNWNKKVRNKPIVYIWIKWICFLFDEVARHLTLSSHNYA